MPVLIMQVLLGTRRAQKPMLSNQNHAQSEKVSPATVSQNVARLLEGRSRASKEKMLDALLWGYGAYASSLREQ